MAMMRSAPEALAFTGRFQSVEIGEPISVLVGTFRSPLDQGRLLGELTLRRLQELTLVVHVPLHLPPLEMGELLDLAAGIARKVVVTTSPVDRGSTVSLTVDDLRSECRRQRPCLLLFEPESQRAVVGSMLALEVGDTFALVWPDDPDLPDPTALIIQGARWRASLESAEDGEFYWLPPEPGSP